MSASQCIACEAMVFLWEKYCMSCVALHGVAQDATFHKTNRFEDWDRDRKIEFEKDLQAVSHGMD